MLVLEAQAGRITLILHQARHCPCTAGRGWCQAWCRPYTHHTHTNGPLTQREALGSTSGCGGGCGGGGGGWREECLSAACVCLSVWVTFSERVGVACRGGGVTCYSTLTEH